MYKKTRGFLCINLPELGLHTNGDRQHRLQLKVWTPD